VIVDEDFADEAEGEYILAYDTGGFINHAIGEAKGNFRLEFDACLRGHQAALPGWGITAASSQLGDGNLKIIDVSFHIGENLFSVNVWTEEGSEFLAMNALTNVIDQDIGAVSHIEMSAEGGVIRLIVNDQLRAATSWPTQDTNHSFDWGVFNETEVGFDNLRIEENQSMIGSFAEPSQPAKISLYAMEENAPADTPVVLTTGWIADTEAQVEGFLDSMFIEVSVDGEYLPLAYEMWGEVEPYKDDDDDGDMDYISYWVYPVGILRPGEHLVETAGSLSSEIYDGWDTREPGALWDWELILAIGD
jgi:hypothetical protein